MSLRHFSSDELILSKEDCYAILKFYFRSDLSLMPGQLTDEDRSFAQALLLEGMEATAAMGIIQSLEETFLYHRPTDFHQLEELCRKFVKSALKAWFKQAKDAFLKDPKIYVMIRDQTARSWRSEMLIRQQTGSYVGY